MISSNQYSCSSTATSTFFLLFLHNSFLLFVLFNIIIISSGRSADRVIGIGNQQMPAGYGPPRFKQNARSHQFAYLGDTIRFKCNAIGRPQPKVHWYRERRYLNYSYMLRHPRLKERGMSLEVKRIEVGDRGNWTCRVWNNEGSTSRNFTLHIVDFCDYFLNVHIHPRRIPEECLCQWAIQQRESLQASSSDLFHLRALPQLRVDLDLSEFVTNNGSRCAHYAKVEEIARLRTQPREDALSELISNRGWDGTEEGGEEEEDEEEDEHTPNTRDITPATINSTPITTTITAIPAKSAAVKWTVRNLSAKIQLARQIVKEMKPDGSEREQADEDEEEQLNDAKWWHKESTAPTLLSSTTTTAATTTSTLTTTRSTRPSNWLTTKRWSLPQRVPPYFRQLDEQTLTHIVIPAGRTLKLSCKAGGQPEPQVVWRKGNEEILRDTESRTGSLFQQKKWTLELEDATENDSGEYACEVFNSAGVIVRRFKVEVQDRIRSRPILVPNVLLNKTVDVNGTVDFSCQVISDLVPHIVWIKLIKKDGSFTRWDTKRQQYTFNFMDMNTQKRARIFHDKDTNRYSLEIVNVTMDDQGIYSCVAGNTLGMSMANATLTVNEFRPLTLPTDVSHSWPLSYTVLLILSFLLLCAFVSLGMLYLFFSKKFSAKNRIQTLDSMSVRKKVVITKKPQREGDFWSDLASSYSITVEPVPVMRNRERGAGRMRAGESGGSTGDMVPLMGAGHGLQALGGAGGGGDLSPLSDYEVPTDMNWEIERERLQLVDILGEGAFGEVWRGLLRPMSGEAGVESMPVAVKRLKTAAQERELIILVSEMQILKSIGHHPNILRLIGCCTGVGPLLVVLELCVHGNLKDFLRKHRPRESERQISEDGYEEEEEEDEERDKEEEVISSDQKESSDQQSDSRKRMYQNVDNKQPTGSATAQMPNRQLTLRDLVRFAADIAKGMDFLASKKIIHRDLAARNVLVAENLVMKISDFGLSRNVFYHDYYRKRGAGRLPIKWMAPEALEANVYTVHSDVWSYGILLWEIMTLGGTPYPSIAMPQLYNLLKEGYRMEAPHNCPDEIYEVMVSCWQDTPEARPAFRTIFEYFEWMLQESENYNRSSDGETTDEGPYAVITEEQNKQSEATGGTTGVGGIGGGQGQGRTISRRPMSAPGLMSFEMFSREMGARAMDDEPQAPAAVICPSVPSAPVPPPLPKRRILLEQLQRVMWKGQMGGSATAAGEPLIELGSDEGSAEEEQQTLGRGDESAKNIYKNLQSAPSTMYANTMIVPCNMSMSVHHHRQGGSSCSAEAISPAAAGPSSQPPHQTHPKKSVVSEHGLRVHGVLFTGIAQQNVKLAGGGWPKRQDGSSKGIGSAGSSSFGRSPVGSSTRGLRLGAWRSRSVDSSSSGHGGSSAMSSAEGLLGGGGGGGGTVAGVEEEAEEEEEEARKPMTEEGGTVDYVSIAPIGAFPLKQ